jgi:excisionase family DNA binding protein
MSWSLKRAEEAVASVHEVGLDDEVDLILPSEGSRPWPQWVWTLIAFDNNTEVWAHQQAEEAKNALWVKPAGPFQPDQPRIVVKAGTLRVTNLPDPTITSRLARIPELTPKQVAYFVQVPEKTIVALCAQGRIPGAKKIGRRWRVNTKSFLQWCEQPTAEVSHEHARSETWGVERRNLASRPETNDHVSGLGSRRQDLRSSSANRNSGKGHHRSKNIAELRELLR